MGLILQNCTKTNMREVQDHSQKIKYVFKNCVNNSVEYLSLRHTSGSWLGFSDILSDFRLLEVYTIYTCLWAKI